MLSQSADKLSLISIAVPILLCWQISGVTPLIQNAVTDRVIPAKFDEIIHASVSSKQDGLLRFKYELSNATTAVRVWVQSFKATLEEPILVVIRRQKAVLSWQLPLPMEDRYFYNVVGRTLCPPGIMQSPLPLNDSLSQIVVNGSADTENSLRLDPIYIEFSTSNPSPVQFSVLATLMHDFLININEPKYFEVTPSQPQFYGFLMPEDMESVTVNVRSPDDKCLIVSVQDVQCPVFDLDTDVTSVGRYQAVLKKGIIHLRRSQYKEFFLVFVAKPNDESCTGKPNGASGLSDLSQTKAVEVWIKESVKLSEYFWGVVTPLLIFIAICIVSLFCLIYFDYVDHRDPVLIKARKIALANCQDEKLLGSTEEELDPRSQPDSKSMVVAMKTISVNDDNLFEDHGGLERAATCPNFEAKSSSVNVDKAEKAGAEEVVAEKGKKQVNITVKTQVYVSDLATKTFKELSLQYRLYLWNIVTLSIFFALPAALVVYTYRKVVARTGNEDILVCYYNYECSRPLRPFYAFNAIYSNAGYFLLGVLFLCIVGHRHWKHRRHFKECEILETKYGVPRHFGLYYAMGYALITEGVLSACYHVCPNHTNFQFDTTFMFIMASLYMIKLYQNRHPDITPSSHAACFALAVLTLITMIGAIYDKSVALWVCFGIAFFSFVGVASIEFYYNGQWKFNLALIQNCIQYIKREYQKGFTWETFRPMYLDRMIFLIICNVANLLLIWWGIIQSPMAFAMFIIVILFCDLMLYLIFYLIMKVYHREPFKKRTLVLGVMSVALWCGSLVCFLRLGSDWTLSPAQSRELNNSCILFDFYDAHDVWHFLSALSLFLSFVVNLIMDDGLKYTHQRDIAVF